MSHYQICTQCVLDTSDPDIHFDKEGVCHHCTEYKLLRSDRNSDSQGKFEQIIQQIKKRGKSYPYDCILALSGGTDSSYLLHVLKDHGLRVLAVHFDSGWNTDEAVHNVKTLTDKMGIDLYSYSVDWEEFRALQIAYLKAGVIDLDVPTDHSLIGSLYKAAADKNVPFILTGHNFETESIMPDSWVTDKQDSWNILDIYRQFGDGRKLKTFPLQTLRTKFINYNLKRIEMVFALNHLKYNKEEAGAELQKEYGWEPVRVKHGESIWTRFYQCHILPTRFGVDKRRAHFSNFIVSGVISRKDAMDELQNPIYKDNLEEDMRCVLDRLEISKEEFERFMNAPRRKHSDFKSERVFKRAYAKIRSLIPFLRISTRH